MPYRLSWHQTQWRELLQRRAALRTRCCSGQGSIGKLDFVRKLAQSIACESPARRRRCDACQSCRWFAAPAILTTANSNRKRASAELLADETDATESGNPRRQTQTEQEIRWKKSGICRISSI